MQKRASLFYSRGAAKSGIFVLLIALMLVASIGGMLTWDYAKNEKEKSLIHWQVVSSLVANSRAKDVNSWLENQLSILDSLSDNTSLRLYMTELEQDGEGQNNSTKAEPEYLRILLQVTSERSDFRPYNPPEKIQGNAAFTKTAGIALLDKQKKLVAVTSYMPDITGHLAGFVEEAKPGDKQFLDIFQLEGAGNARMISFLVPVYAVQGDKVPDDQIGYVLGVTEISDKLFEKLYQPGLPYKNSETLLVRKVDNIIEYISPLEEKSIEPLKLDANTPKLDASYLINNQGGFAQKIDYRKKEVLAAATKLNIAPWYLIHKIDADVAFAGLKTRIKGAVIALILITALMLAITFGVWRHANLIRSEMVSRQHKLNAIRISRQEQLLRLITDNNPDSVFIIDKLGNYRFVNQKAADAIKLKPSQILGKHINDVIGAHKGERFLKASFDAYDKNKTLVFLHREKTEGGQKVIQRKFIPLTEIPDPYTEEKREGILIIEHDISKTVLEKEKYAKTLNSLVSSLTAVMDHSIPFTSNHSYRVSVLSQIIADEMGLPFEDREVCRFAGSLMNLGKMFLPQSLLVKDGPITDDERRKLQESVLLSADLIKDIEFNGPVVDTIKQVNEKTDGTGLLGLKIGEILPTARIVAVANAFVSMASKRPHRASHAVEESLKLLQSEAGTKYDRGVVAALANYLENKSNDNSWLLS